MVQQIAPTNGECHSISDFLGWNYRIVSQKGDIIGWLTVKFMNELIAHNVLSFLPI